MKIILGTILMGFMLNSNNVFGAELPIPHEGNSSGLVVVQEDPSSRLWEIYGASVALYSAGDNEGAIARFLTMLPVKVQDSINELMSKDLAGIDIHQSCEDVYNRFEGSFQSEPEGIRNAFLGGLGTCLDRVKTVLTEKQVELERQFSLVVVQEDPSSKLDQIYTKSVALYLNGDNEGAIESFLTMLPKHVQDSINELMTQNLEGVDIHQSCEGIYNNYRKSLSSEFNHVQNIVIGGLGTCLQRVEIILMQRQAQG